MEHVIAAATALTMLAGAFFALSAAIGVVRLPDLYSRMHAASKAGSVGSGLLLLAAGLYSGELAIFARAAAGVVFLLLTAPVAAHLLAKAAHETGHKLWELSVRDDMEGR
ncbi:MULTISPECIES: monovalent cation/H(+) antiporter subunit G [Rhizobium]|uniref:Na+/H+ antiporter subunit G n=1 Tax=Rhizobium gallicum bv. gallicum R602sp TaxID=1041138 RepID=A0A0B4X026_9HYPH|nr:MULTISPECIES: monovalent cation/H(+) antiporter subunit G [Rhizobium]AJD40526.1 Na+/H+ antiporter subunit G [Rhizobium gallicum bv. gallicum R602sp]TDW27685.1 multicomponent Na+:H+ antiporter subunit G [Rhizobium azibense]